MKNLQILLTTVFCFFLILFANYSMAQNIAKISIQGTLKDSNGASVSDGTYTVTFRLYNDATGGSIVWQEEAIVEVIGGIYSHYLGEVTPLAPTIFATTLWLGLRLGNFELTPRTELTYAPYALSVDFAQKVVCSGAVGDIKYSILNPTQFAQENGDCWVPLDGRTLATNQKLRSAYGWNSLPDAGGLFLRSQEFSGGANNDPDRTPGSAIGQIQQDNLGSHSHSANLSGSTNTTGAHFHTVQQTTIFRMASDENGGDNRFDWGSGSLAQTLTIPPSPNTSTSGNHSHTVDVSGNTANTGGTETRPKNMNFWIYIRVN